MYVSTGPLLDSTVNTTRSEDLCIRTNTRAVPELFLGRGVSYRLYQTISPAGVKFDSLSTP